jgi:hypothetical protein
MINKTKRDLNERLDRIGIELVRASSMTRAEAGEVASSPWLFARLRARVAAESERHEAGERWSTILTVIRHAVPAMGLATVVAFGSFLLAGSGSSQSPPQFSDQSMFVTSEAGVEGVVFADRRALSSDEVMETILNGERETAR